MKKLRLLAEWFWDQYILPFWLAFMPQPKDEPPKDTGQTLDDE